MNVLNRHPFFIKLFNWEYWNSKIIYAPLYPYWLWLSLKSRSLFFLTAANPHIKNGGFIMESKNDIYNQLPEFSYPKTEFFLKGTSNTEVLTRFEQNSFNYPVIAKPDLGERGLAVKKIHNQVELLNYAERMPVNFLVQDFVTYEKEVGIFYYRIPGEKTGRISGIVDKYPVVVNGNGINTIEELINQEPRYILQWTQIRNAHSTEKLQEVLKVDESFLLIPYGNHSRGSKFINESSRVNPELEALINSICCAMPDFYYGRLDIRFTSWDKLYKGEEYSVIEVNGSGSEPTHIYDPSQSLFYAWKEIIRHWNILHKISKANHQNGVEYLSFLTIYRDLNEFSDIDALLSQEVW